MGYRRGAVWKDAWLGLSETFIRDQIRTVPDWKFIKLGFHTTDHPLVEPDYAPYGSSSVQRNLRRVFGTSLHQAGYEKALELSEAEVIHAHFLSGGMNASKLANKMALPLVTTLHNPRVTPEQNRLPRTFHPTYFRRLHRLLERGTKFIAVSNYVADAAVSAGVPSDRIEVLHIGVPIVPRIQSEQPRGIVFVGRLIEMKGAGDLLEAVNQLPLSLRNVPVTIIGDGPQRTVLEQLAQQHRLNVSFTGWVSSSKLPQLLAQHEVFCGPSKSDLLGVQEGFGLVYLEAALQGLPCVAYRSGGVVDAVADGKSGILADEGDVDSLANTLEILLRDTATAEEMGRNGRRRVERDFDILKQSRHLDELLKYCVNS